MPGIKQHARTAVGLAAAAMLLTAVALEWFDVITLTSQHITILSSLITAGLGLDIVTERYHQLIEVLDAVTDTLTETREDDDER